MPGGGGGARLGLAVADDAGDDQVGVVHRRAEGGRQRVAQLAALVDRAGDAGIEVAGEAAGPGEALDEACEPGVSRGVSSGWLSASVPSR